MNPIGLTKNDLSIIITEIQKYPDIESAKIFGSRALGTYKEGSDIDISIHGKNISSAISLQLSDQLNNETILPYFFDIVHYDTLNNPDLKNHIDTIGISLI